MDMSDHDLAVAFENHSSTSEAHGCSDLDLQIVRRLDWRYLFPDPRLRRVACVGAQDGELVSALKRFSEFLEIVPSCNGTLPSPRMEPLFDWIVLQSSSQQDLQLAGDLLKPGGYLYWEVDRRSSRRLNRESRSRTRQNGASRVRFIRTYCRRLEWLGFSEIAAYWHRPNFQKCLEIIPIQDPCALHHVFSRPRSDFSGRLKLAAGRVLSGSGILSLWVPCFSLAAKKPASPGTWL